MVLSTAALGILVCNSRGSDVPVLLFYQGFEAGLDAQFANGSGRAFHSHNLSFTQGVHSYGVWVTPKNFLRYDADGNLDMDASTIAVWVSLNWDPPARRPSFGGIYQTIWRVGAADGNEIGLRLNARGDRTYLEFLTSRTGAPLSGVVTDMTPGPGKGWMSGEWHEVVCSWKKPGTLRLVVDGAVVGENRNAPIPNLTPNDMLSLYLGVNREDALGRMDHFDGAIDEVRIYSGFNAEVGEVDASKLQTSEDMPGLRIPWGCPEGLFRPAHDPSVRWVSKCSYRINVLAANQAKPWTESPAWVFLDFPQILQRLNVSGAVDLKTIRVVEFDPLSGEPVVFDRSQTDERGYFQPYVLDASFEWSQSGKASWIKRGSCPRSYSIYFDARPVYDGPYPAEQPLVGNGDRLRIGRKGDVGRLSVGIWGEFDVADLDQDGDPDLWVNSGTMTATDTDLQLGHYYFENLGRIGIGGEYVFAPGRLVKNCYGNAGFGPLTGSSSPFFVDIDRDGSLDLLYVGKYCAEWWRLGWEGKRPVIVEWHMLDFGQTFDAGTSPSSSVAWNLPMATYVDWDGDGKRELIGAQYIYHNIGSDIAPSFDMARRSPLTVILERNHREVDWDGDGDLDIIAADRFPQIWFYENVGTRTAPRMAPGKVLETHDGHEIQIPGQLNCVVPCDWDGDGDLDLVWGGEDGFIGVVENVADFGRSPRLAQSRLVQQIEPWVDAGSLAIPQVCDWDGDGDLDVVTGGSDAYILFFENEGTNSLPAFAEPVEMEAGGKVIQLIAGPDGSVQGAKEAYWGYNNPEVADWDTDGDLDLIVSGIRGDHTYFENVGTRNSPVLASARKIEVEWEGTPLRPPWLPYKAEGNELVTVWRSRPEALDWNGDGLVDYVCLDHLGILALYERYSEGGALKLAPGRNIFAWDQGTSGLRIWSREPGAVGGGSGRTVIDLVDWDGDGDHDLIADCMNARLYENVADDAGPCFMDRGDLVSERLVNHNTGPCVVDWDRDGMLDLFVGAESGQIYYFHRAHIEGDCAKVGLLSVERRSSEIGTRGPDSGPSLGWLALGIVFTTLILGLVIRLRLSRSKRGLWPEGYRASASDPSCFGDWPRSQVRLGGRKASLLGARWDLKGGSPESYIGGKLGVYDDACAIPSTSATMRGGLGIPGSKGFTFDRHLDGEM